MTTRTASRFYAFAAAAFFTVLLLSGIDRLAAPDAAVHVAQAAPAGKA